MTSLFKAALFCALFAVVAFGASSVWPDFKPLLEVLSGLCLGIGAASSAADEHRRKLKKIEEDKIKAAADRAAAKVKAQREAQQWLDEW